MNVSQLNQSCWLPIVVRQIIDVFTKISALCQQSSKKTRVHYPFYWNNNLCHWNHPSYRPQYCCQITHLSNSINYLCLTLFNFWISGSNVVQNWLSDWNFFFERPPLRINLYKSIGFRFFVFVAKNKWENAFYTQKK